MNLFGTYEIGALLVATLCGLMRTQFLLSEKPATLAIPGTDQVLAGCQA